MDFIDQLKQFSKRVETLQGNIQTEEATKTSLIMPFFSLLGYDVFNPQEFVPEFTADVGIKKGEKVDYAILLDDKPTILIEAKWIGEKLDNHDSQLFRYFGTTTAKLAILTNGMYYRFYTDLEETNKMDTTPFMEINLLDIKEAQVTELKKFHKSVFDVNNVLDSASELKYVNEFKSAFNDELSSPTDSFVRHFLTSVYPGPKTQSVIEKFTPILKKSLNSYINELMNEKIKSALNSENETHTNSSSEELQQPKEDEVELVPKNKIITTNGELEAYFIVKHMLAETTAIEDITYKDTESYLGILYKGNVRKWICRIVLTDSVKYLIIPDENKKEIRINLESIYDIKNYSKELIEVLNRYIQ